MKFSIDNFILTFFVLVTRTFALIEVEVVVIRTWLLTAYALTVNSVPGLPFIVTVLHLISASTVVCFINISPDKLIRLASQIFAWFIKSIFH